MAIENRTHAIPHIKISAIMMFIFNSELIILYNPIVQINVFM